MYLEQLKQQQDEESVVRSAGIVNTFMGQNRKEYYFVTKYLIVGYIIFPDNTLGL